MKNFLPFTIFLLFGHYCHSQLNNTLLYSANPDSLIDKDAKFGFFINNLNYIRNTEYHSTIDQGATWAGTQIWPQGIYRHNDKLSFKLGVFIQKDFGNNKFRTLIPTYTLTYKIKNLMVNFGTLEGSLDHNLIEPLYAIENFIDNRIENGLQFKGKTWRIQYDLWLDWEKMIYRTSTTQEQFTAGVSTNLKIIEKENFKISFPIQLTGRHRGGEIYAQPHNNIKSQLDFAYGIHVLKNRPKKFIDNIDFQGYLTFYEDLSPSKADSFRDGTGAYLALTLKKKNWAIMLNYYDAFQYISPVGEPMLTSKSREYPGNYLQYRKLAMFRIFYEVPLWQNSALVVRINNMFDLTEKSYNNVFEAYFKFNIGFSRKKH